MNIVKSRKYRNQITEYLIEASGQQEFSAEFQYKDITYILTGIIEKNEFEKFWKIFTFLKKSERFCRLVRLYNRGVKTMKRKTFYQK